MQRCIVRITLRTSPAVLQCREHRGLGRMSQVIEAHPDESHLHPGNDQLVSGRNGPSSQRKNTVLVQTGKTIVTLLDVTNLGVWMAHCHIAEHHESGMMLTFHVTEI